MIRSVDELGRAIWEEHGVHLQFHPHAGSHVETRAQTERFLADTDPRYVNLCLDTGHVAYRRGDSVALIRGYPDRVRYVDIKAMDPVDFDIPLPIATCTREYLRAAGISG